MEIQYNNYQQKYSILDVMEINNISYGAKGLYAYIYSFKDVNEEMYPTRDIILKHLNINKNTYHVYLKELYDKNIIYKKELRSEGKFDKVIHRPL